MALWTYSDWITKTDPTERLERLRLHIQEVSERTIARRHRTKENTAVDAGYLSNLQKQEAELSRRMERRPAMNFTRLSRGER